MIKAGDRVMISRKFLYSCQIYTGDVPFWVGTVEEIREPLGIAYVQWDGKLGPSAWLLMNLTKKENLHKETS